MASYFKAFWTHDNIHKTVHFFNFRIKFIFSHLPEACDLQAVCTRKLQQNKGSSHPNMQPVLGTEPPTLHFMNGCLQAKFFNQLSLPVLNFELDSINFMCNSVATCLRTSEPSGYHVFKMLLLTHGSFYIDMNFLKLNLKMALGSKVSISYLISHGMCWNTEPAEQKGVTVQTVRLWTVCGI